MTDLQARLVISASVIAIIGSGLYIFMPRAPSAPVAETEVTLAPTWQYLPEDNLLRGTTRNIARIESRAPLATRYGSARVWLTIWEDDSEALFVTSDVATCSSALVPLRIDDGEVEYATCAPLPGYSMILRPTDFMAPAKPFARRLRGAHRLVIEVPTFDSPTPVVFDVKGLAL